MSQPPPEEQPPGNRPSGNQPPPHNPPPPGGQPPGGYPPGGPPPGNQPAEHRAGGHGGPPPRKPGSGMAVVTLIFGILALLLCWTVIFGLLFGLIALILGLVALSKARKGTASGRPMAIIGIVLGLLGAAISGVLLALGVAFFGEAQNYAECIDDAGSDQAAIEQCNEDFQDEVENRIPN